MATMDLMRMFKESPDPIYRYLANGGSWATAVEMWDERRAEERMKEEAERLEKAVESIPKWEAQLEAVVRKGSKTPSALKHKARLLESLREAYGQANRDRREADAFLAALEAQLAPKGGSKPKTGFAALADSDSD